MKKTLSLLTVLILLTALLTGCGAKSIGDYEVNLIPDDTLAPSLLYSLAFNIVEDPSDYVGKTVCAEGSVFEDMDGVLVIEIADEKGCCYQNIPIQLAEDAGDVIYDEVYHAYGTFQLKDGKVYIAVDKVDLAFPILEE